MNVDANPGAVTRHMQENLCPWQKLKITVISGFRTKIAVVANYRAKIAVHCRGFWLPYKNYCGDQLPCNNCRALPWWLATVQSIPWLPITVHQLLCNTVVAAYRGKRYRDEKSLPRKALEISNSEPHRTGKGPFVHLLEDDKLSATENLITLGSQNRFVVLETTILSR